MPVYNWSDSVTSDHFLVEHGSRTVTFKTRGEIQQNVGRPRQFKREMPHSRPYALHWYANQLTIGGIK